MTKILVCLDGTGNEPADAVQERDREGVEKDASISNVLKLHILAGGRLDNSGSNMPGQHSLYFSGVGTRGFALRRALSSAFAITDPDRIVDNALETLCDVAQEGDELSVFGFSRGAALARRLVSRLEERGLARDEKSGPGPRPRVRLLGVWDTVASFGIPDLDQDVRPATELGEHGSLGSCVETAFHLVALDDIRRAFTPTLMNREERVHEIWFPGVHSDVGGGYREDQLSDVALKFMLERAEKHAKLEFKKPEQIDLAALTESHDAKNPAEIGLDDLRIDPNPAGRLHIEQFASRRGEIGKSRTVADRKVHVVHDDAVDPSAVPVLHPAVLERVKADSDYRPKNLEGLRYTLWGEEPARVYVGPEQRPEV